MTDVTTIAAEDVRITAPGSVRDAGRDPRWRRGGRPVTVCWDPDPPRRGMTEEKGVYLVLTGNVMDDKPVLDEGGRLSRPQFAQALRTTRTLRERGRPVARLHLHHRWTGIAQLLDAAHQGGRA